MRRLASALFLSVVLSACATAGSGKINWDNARKVKTGMNQQEVQALMGSPYMVKTVGKDELRWVWVYASAFGGSESMSLTLKDGKVTEVPQIPDSFK